MSLHEVMLHTRLRHRHKSCRDILHVPLPGGSAHRERSRAGAHQWGMPRSWAGRGESAGAARGGGAHRTRSSGPAGPLDLADARTMANQVK
jgi:hypothetical protein